MKALAEFGRNFGNAFQIIDDCLDFTANQKEFGKTLGTDLAAGVMTLPLIYLMRSKPELRSQIIGLIEKSASPDALGQLTGLLTEHGAIEYALQCARDYSAQALRSLDLLPESAARQSLEKLAGYILERTK